MNEVLKPLADLLDKKIITPWTYEEEMLLLENPLTPKVELARLLHEKFGTNRSIILVESHRKLLLSGSITQEEIDLVASLPDAPVSEVKLRVFERFGVLRDDTELGRPKLYHDTLHGDKFFYPSETLKNHPPKKASFKVSDTLRMDGIYDDPPF